mgnify:CR=1 FL=1
MSRAPASFDKARFVSAPHRATPLPVVPLVSAEHFARFVADYLADGRLAELPGPVIQRRHAQHPGALAHAHLIQQLLPRPDYQQLIAQAAMRNNTPVSCFLAALALYIGFTVWVTEWRTRFRVQANAADSAAHNHAIDSLLNYETVKYFGNEGFEARRYDESLRHYQHSRLKSQSSLSLLNTGQQLIIGTGLVAMLWRATAGVADGRGAPGLGAPVGRGLDAPVSLPPAWGNDSRSRRATGASTVDDADLTNSPCSLRRSSTCLLVTPSSLANSCTRALPATALLTWRSSGLPATTSWLRPIRAHRGNFTVCSCLLLPVFDR